MNQKVANAPKYTGQPQLIQEVLRARERIYHVNRPTPLEEVRLPDIDADIFLKREDLSAINAYKWRGAYNAIAMLDEEQRKKPVIASSAGNHAQGVALAARMLGLKAKIFMPRTTPKMKQMAVQKHGGGSAEVILGGDTYSDVAGAALAEAEKTGGAYIHPFDNLYTIAGQATIADELVLSGKGPFDYAFLQIGGGGLAAGVSSWLRIHYPDITIIGVEGEGQACMKAAFEAGKPVSLDDVDGFCDGTAVRIAGELTYEICRETLDDIITVSNEEVCAAIERTWEIGRFIPEPSGAMGLAGLIKYARQNKDAVRGKKLATLICGANMDFSKLRLISASAAVGAQRTRHLCLEIGEKEGSLLDLIDTYFQDVNVSAFQYGKVAEDKAWPVIGFEAEDDAWEMMIERLQKAGIAFDDVTGEPDTRYRVINYDPHLFENPLFLHVHFPERKGALREMLKAIKPYANICYFNYVYTGEAIGRALMGFEFNDPAQQEIFYKKVEETGVTYRIIEEKTLQRLIYKS